MGKLTPFDLSSSLLRHQLLWLVPASFAAFVLGIGNNWWDHTREIASLAKWMTLVAFFLWFAQEPQRLVPTAGQAFFIVLTVVFLAFLYLHHNPHPLADGTDMRVSDYWWRNFLVMSGSAVVLGVLAVEKKTQYWILGAISFSSFLLSLSFGFATFCIENHAFGQGVYNWLTGAMVNRAGALNLLIYFPVFLMALVVNGKFRSAYLISIGVICVILLIGLCFIHENRTPILVLLILAPITVLLIEIFRKDNFLEWLRKTAWKQIIPSTLAVGILIYLCNATIFSERPIGISMLADSRFTMYHRAFLEQLISNPFKYSIVPSNIGHPWFHNFFADIHRSSGLWAFLTAIMLNFWIVARTFHWARRDNRGQVCLAVLIPLFLVMNTSVVPEGEMQPFLIFIMLGALAESGLKRIDQV